MSLVLFARCVKCNKVISFSLNIPTTLVCQAHNCGGNMFVVSTNMDDKLFQNHLIAKRGPGNEPLERISVIITCHNLLAVTQKCVEAVRKSIIKPHEIILVDNGSTDGTEEWAESQDYLKHVRLETNIGCAMGRNEGAKVATGDWLLFLDNDQYVSPTTLGMMIGKTKECFDIVGVEKWVVDAQGNTRQAERASHEIEYVGSGGMLIPKMIFDDLGGYDQRYAPAWYADTDLIMTARQKGYFVGHQPGHNVKHEGHLTVTSQNDYDSNAIKERSRKRFSEKWSGKWGSIMGGSKKRLKILVIEWNIARISGRMSTMVRFADAFKMLGHKVMLVSSFFPEDIKKREDLLKWHQAKVLTECDVDTSLVPHYQEVPGWMRQYDLAFVSWPFGYMADLPGMPKVISWYIMPRNPRPRNILEYWTNSLMQHGILFTDRWIYPPYDYLPFRNAAKPFSEREYDICYAARNNTGDKKMQGFVNMCREEKLKGALCVLGGIRINDDVDIDVWEDAPKEQVAKMMGNTKVYYHPSVDESAAIAIYEALNAGCWPVVYGVGAAREQVGEHGTVYTSNSDKIIRGRLRGGWDIGKQIEWGRRFDIESNLDKLDQMLGEVAKKL